MMGNKKIQVWLPLFFSILLIVGMFLGYQLNTPPGEKNQFFSSNNSSTLGKG
jgi:carboxyl-terminal processing protease